VRFLADECVGRRIVQRLRDARHDVLWVSEFGGGSDDESLLRQSVAESRILLTEDWDFGELSVRLKRPALGIVIIALPAAGGETGSMADNVARRLTEIGEEGLIGKLTIVEAGRLRQRDLEEGIDR
jgi:predicted nuclease of predicted toxin-antitoxin system